MLFHRLSKNLNTKVSKNRIRIGIKPIIESIRPANIMRVAQKKMFRYRSCNGTSLLKTF